MMAMPRTNMFDIMVFSFSFTEQLFLKVPVGKKFDGCSRGLRASRKKIGDDDSIIAVFASILIGRFDVPDIFATLLACRVALNFSQNVIENMAVEEDLIV